MNALLSIRRQLVARALTTADVLGKSLSRLVRNCWRTTHRADDTERGIEEFDRLSGQGHMRGWRFNRNEIHERS